MKNQLGVRFSKAFQAKVESSIVTNTLFRCYQFNIEYFHENTVPKNILKLLPLTCD